MPLSTETRKPWRRFCPIHETMINTCGEVCRYERMEFRRAADDLWKVFYQRQRGVQVRHKYLEQWEPAA